MARMQKMMPKLKTKSQKRKETNWLTSQENVFKDTLNLKLTQTRHVQPTGLVNPMLGFVAQLTFEAVAEIYATSTLENLPNSNMEREMIHLLRENIFLITHAMIVSTHTYKPGTKELLSLDAAMA